PEASSAMLLTISFPAAPKRFDQTCTPAAVYLAMNKSTPPALVNAGCVPLLKSTVPEKYPSTKVFPLESTVTAQPLSAPVLPRPLAQGPAVEVEELLTVTVRAGAMVEFPA